MRLKTRRDLLRLLASGGASYATLYMLGCGSSEEPMPTPVGRAPAAPPTATSLPPTATPAPPTDTPEPAATSAREAEAEPTATEEPEPTATPTPEPAALAVVHGADAAEITRRAVSAVGGMARYVSPGQTVIVKPNICNVPRGPEYASTTHPDVVAAVVTMALEVGARQVQVMDSPFAGRPDAAYEASGIAAAVKQAGGEMVVMSPLAFADTPIPDGRSVSSWSIYQPGLEADVLIDVPVAKHHNMAGLTLGMKNLMGMLQPQGRGRFHNNLHQNIADLSTLFRPALTVMDATRMLMEGGPTGGKLDYVRQQDTVIAGPDIVAVDAYTATLFGRWPLDIGYIANAVDMGLGRADLDGMRIDEFAL